MATEVERAPAGLSGSALGISALAAAYRDGTTTITDVVEEVLSTIADRGDDGTWITVADRDDLLAQARRLQSDPSAADLPLYGIPFGVKDSIDVAGWPTTLACPGYAYVAERRPRWCSDCWTPARS